jgi:hypothetical protein
VTRSNILCDEPLFSFSNAPAQPAAIVQAPQAITGLPVQATPAFVQPAGIIPAAGNFAAGKPNPNPVIDEVETCVLVQWHSIRNLHKVFEGYLSEFVQRLEMCACDRHNVFLTVETFGSQSLLWAMSRRQPKQHYLWASV